MDAEVRIEQLTDVDREVVEAVGRLLPQLSSSACPLSRDDIRGIAGAEATTVFVARVDGRVVGMLTLVVFTIPTGARAWIEDVVVDGDARGRGIARRSPAGRSTTLLSTVRGPWT